MAVAEHRMIRLLVLADVGRKRFELELKPPFAADPPPLITSRGRPRAPGSFGNDVLSAATRVQSASECAPYQSRCPSDRPSGTTEGLGVGLVVWWALRRDDPTCWPSPKRPGFGCESPNEVIKTRASVAASELLCSLEPRAEITSGRAKASTKLPGPQRQERARQALGEARHCGGRSCARVGQLGGELLGPSTSCGCTVVSPGEISTIRIRVVRRSSGNRQTDWRGDGHLSQTDSQMAGRTDSIGGVGVGVGERAKERVADSNSSSPHALPALGCPYSLPHTFLVRSPA